MNILPTSSTTNYDVDFHSAYSPQQLNILALVSHNEMKLTMKEFVMANKNILKKFRLTGTSSTMKMLKEIFRNDPSISYGPSCSSGPLGGDAELAALMTQGKIGGMVFFQDPMSAHPHRADIESLCRLALVHNTLMAGNPTTALMMMNILRTAISGDGRPELIPSFFFSLKSPSVSAYEEAQKKRVQNLSSTSHKEVVFFFSFNHTVCW